MTATPGLPQLPITADDVEHAQFAPTRFRPGYSQPQVDDFLDRVIAALREPVGILRQTDLTRQDVMDQKFQATYWREGYDQAQVDELLNRVVRALPRPGRGPGRGRVKDGYRLLVTGEVGDRDGWSLELVDDASGYEFAEVFEDDATRERTVQIYSSAPVPFAAMKWLLDEAERGI